MKDYSLFSDKTRKKLEKMSNEESQEIEQEFQNSDKEGLVKLEKDFYFDSNGYLYRVWVGNNELGYIETPERDEEWKILVEQGIPFVEGWGVELTTEVLLELVVILEKLKGGVEV